MHVVLCPAATSPLKFTVSPLSQLPVSAKFAATLLKTVFAAGLEILTTGAVASRTTVTLAVDVFPAASAVLRLRVLLPSAPVKLSACEKVPPEHVVLTGEPTTPLLEIEIPRLPSQVPVIVKAVLI